MSDDPGRAVRRAFLDRCPGERRGVVTLDGRPERLLIERAGEGAAVRLGERRLVRLGPRAPNRREAFADLGEAGPALLRLPPDVPAAEGALAEAEVVAEARTGKAPVLRWIGPAGEGAATSPTVPTPGLLTPGLLTPGLLTPGLLTPGPTLEARLAAWSGGGAVGTGEDAREAADEAEAQTLATEHPLGDGLVLTIQPTRALVAADLDWRRAGEPTGRRLLEANLLGLGHLARLLRLKALGGTVALDLVGFPRDERLVRAAEAAFAPDEGAQVLAPNRLGVLMLSRPHGARPLHEILCDPFGAPTLRTLAQRAVRALEREGRSHPGRLVEARCAPAVAEALKPLASELGPRFRVRKEVGFPAGSLDIRPL